MNILINCLSAVSGGAVNYLRNILPALAVLCERSAQPHRLFLLAHHSQKHLLPPLSESDCVILSGSRPKGPARLIWESLNLPSVIRRRKIDVLFTPYQIAPALPCVKHVMMLRNMEPFLFDTYPNSFHTKISKRIFRAISCRSLQNADRIIAVSRYTAAFLTDTLSVPQNRISLIYHGRDPSFSPAGDKVKDCHTLLRMGLSGDYILSPGSLQPYRRCEDVVSAFELIAPQKPSLKLVLAADTFAPSYTAKIKKLIRTSPFPDRLILIARVPHEDMKILYRNCTVCVIASEIEACPNIAIEALSSGCAIISADRPPLPEIFAGASLEYTSRNVIALADTISRCLIDMDLRRTLSRKAITRALDFSWQKCAARTFSALADWNENYTVDSQDTASSNNRDLSSQNVTSNL